MNRKHVIALLLILTCLMLSSCEKYDSIPENSNNFPPINPLPEDKIEIILYYPNDSMDYLVPEFRVVSRRNERIEEIAVHELLKGNTQKKLTNVIPSSTKLLSMDITDNIAYVSFSGDLINKSYSEKEEALVIYSIVNTLTSLPSIDEVQILIDGKAKDILYECYSIREPLKFSSTIVTKDYISPISVINEFYDSLLNKNYDKSISMLDLDDDSGQHYNTIKAYLRNGTEGINHFSIDNYTIYNYSDEVKLNLKITFTYGKNEIKKSRKEIKLIYNGETFLIRELMY